MTRMGFLAIALSALVVAGCDRRHGRETDRDGRPAAATADKDRMGLLDRNFIDDVAAAGMAEIELGRMAAERASEPQVKKFGQLMVDDHTPAADKLKAIFSQHGVDWPAELDSRHRDKRDDLDRKKGADFDRDYMAFMVDAHEDLVDKLESRIDKTNLPEWKAEMDNRAADEKARERAETGTIVPEKNDNPVTSQINAWAAAVYPTAYTHLQRARTLDSAVRRRATN